MRMRDEAIIGAGIRAGLFFEISTHASLQS
jgi:hypothetical protein